MPIILAKTAGFCYGVRRAMKLALTAAQTHKTNLFTLGPLIHNRQAVDLLKSRGISITDSVDNLPPESRVLIRAHGIKPKIRRLLMERCTEVCDATCPHVTAAQNIVRTYTSRGYSCIIIGDRGHAEVEGLLGCAGDRGYVVEDEEDIRKLPEMDKVCIISQTTQEREKFERIVERIKKRNPDARVFNTICNATTQRQEELLDIAQKSDLVIVVGGATSANTRRLVEISEDYGTDTIHVETADEIPLEKIDARTVVGITAGASTPHWVIRNVVETVENHQLEKRSVLLRTFHGIMFFAIYSSLILASGAFFLTYTSTSLMRLSFAPEEAFLAFFFVLSMHLINKRLSLPKDERLMYGSLKSFAKYKGAFTILAVFAIISSLILAGFLSGLTFILILLAVILGFAYSFTIIPKSLSRKIHYRKLMDIPGSKDIFMAAAWSVVTVFLPFINRGAENWPGFLVTLAFVVLLVLIRSVLLDVRDLEGDIVLGKETVPILLGFRKSIFLIRGFILLIFLIPLTGWISGLFPADALFLCFLPFYILIHYLFSKRQVLYQSLLYDVYLDAQFILAGMMMFLGSTILG